MSSQVHLAVYDLSRGMASSMSEAILGMRIDGIWHTGIVVFNREYYFGGGIQVAPVGAFAAQSGLMPSQTLEMGNSTKTQAELEAYIRTINHRFTQATYDLIQNNCNNFSDIVCQFMCGHGIPTHIVDLPRIVFSTPGGAMLRPMIEGMQNSIRQQSGGGMDPFGASSSSSSSSVTTSNTFEASLSDQIRNTLVPSLVKAELDESPMVSVDARPVVLLGNKLLSLKDASGTEAEALTTEEKDIVRTVIAKLTSVGTSKTFSSEAYEVLQKLLRDHPSSHMACLFILRIMVVHDKCTAFEHVPIIQEIIRRLSDNDGAVFSFSTMAGNVMGLCAIANLLSHTHGISYILYGTSDASGAAGGSGNESRSGSAGTVLDIALRGLSHDKAEVRQMSCAMAYNLVLSCTQHETVSMLWKDEQVEGELHSHAVQLLCGVLEGLVVETDAASRHRKLALVCRIVRAYKALATTFIEDLGFADSFRILQSDTSVAPPLSKHEKDIINEIVYACQ